MDLRRELHKVEAVLISMGIGYPILGIVLCLKPDFTKKYFGVLLAAVFLVLSVFSFILYMRKERVLASVSMSFTRAGVLLAVAIIVMLKRDEIWDYIVPLIGCLILVSALIKFQKAIDLWRIESNWWIVVLVLSLILLAAGVIFLANPSFVEGGQKMIEIQKEDLIRQQPQIQIPLYYIIMALVLGVDGAATLLTGLIFGLRLNKALRMNDGFMMESPTHSLAPWLHKKKAEPEEEPEEEPEAVTAEAAEEEDPFED